jgi:hypothetical protein
MGEYPMSIYEGDEAVLAGNTSRLISTDFHNATGRPLAFSKLAGNHSFTLTLDEQPQPLDRALQGPLSYNLTATCPENETCLSRVFLERSPVTLSQDYNGRYLYINYNDTLRVQVPAPGEDSRVSFAVETESGRVQTARSTLTDKRGKVDQLSITALEASVVYVAYALDSNVSDSFYITTQPKQVELDIQKST